VIPYLSRELIEALLEFFGECSNRTSSDQEGSGVRQETVTEAQDSPPVADKHPSSCVPKELHSGSGSELADIGCG
jgi:hypothetical protein